MTRLKTRRTPRLEGLEQRSLLTAAGGPSPDAQYMLELINLSRTNPAAMAQWIGQRADANVQATLKYYNVDLQAVENAIASAPAKPPLAWNAQLTQSATGQSQYQADNGVQTHTGANGSNTQDREEAAGYTNQVSDGENAYAYSTSVDEAMEAFLIDWGVNDNGHRNNIMQSNVPAGQQYHDVGIGIVQTNRANFGPNVITQDFGAQQNEKAQLVGVAFNDPSGTNLYSPGNGRGDVTVQVVNQATGTSQSVQTWASGGYKISLAPGNYTVTALVGNKVVRSQDVAIGTQNVEVDFNLSQAWQGTVVSASQTQAQPQAATNNNNSMDVIAAALAALQDTSWSSSWSTWKAARSH
jgi:uncharacterized protein YkwD